MEDYFVDNTNEWVTGDHDGTYAKVTWTLERGDLSLDNHRSPRLCLVGTLQNWIR